MSVGRLTGRLRSWFPDREFFMRSQGQVRFIKLSSRTQLLAAGGAAALLLIWALTMSGMALSGYISSRDRMALLQREAKVASSEGRLNAYGQDITKVADEKKIPWALAGGVAMSYYGSPRLTKDVNIIAS